MGVVFFKRETQFQILNLLHMDAMRGKSFTHLKSEVEQNNGEEYYSLLEVILLKKATQCLLIM